MSPVPTDRIDTIRCLEKVPMKIKDEKQPKDTLEKLDGIHAHAEYENTHIH